MAKNKTTKTVTTTTVTTTVTSSSPKEIYDVLILDRSGSMSTIWHSTVDGVNEYLNKSKRIAEETGAKSYVSLLKFDDVHKQVWDNLLIQEATSLDYTTDGPRGMTALYDAIGTAINKIKTHLKGREKDDNVDVTITIFTDGDENQSREYSYSNIQSLIKAVQSDFGWTVTYVGAGLKENVLRTSAKLGILSTNSMNYSHDAESTTQMFNQMSDSRGVKSMLFASTGLKTNSGYFTGLDPADKKEEAEVK